MTTKTMAARKPRIQYVQDEDMMGRFRWKMHPNPTDDPLVNLWGHEMDEEGKFWRYQFRVHGVTPAGHVVQLHSALDGRTTDIQIWPLERMAKCRFFSRPDEWRDTADRDNRRRADMLKPVCLDPQPFKMRRLFDNDTDD